METNQQNQGSAMPPQTPGDNNNQADQTLMGILAYLGILIVIPFFTESKNNPFVKFHIKQGLVLLIAEIIATVLVAIPFFGWFLSPLIWLASVAFSIVGILNVLNKQTKELPVIGHMASKFNF